MTEDSKIPPGRDHNPSSWRHRSPLIALAIVGFLIAGYMALFQLGVLKTVWEPFFGDGTRAVLGSKIAASLPVSDALLGALAYLADAVIGSVGGSDRWRKMPWIVLLFGLVAGGMSVVSIALILIQAFVVNAWCTLCLASALISLLIVGPAFREADATMRYMRRELSAGRSFWPVLTGHKA